MNEGRKKRSHARIVFECYMELRKSNNPEKVLARYGRKTREDAIRMYHEEMAEEMGMTMEEFEKWLKEVE